MLLVLILFWRCVVPGRPGRPNLFTFISRFRGFNSRLGRRFKFPFRSATGICPQELDLAPSFRGQMAVSAARSMIFPAVFPSHGNFGPSAGGAGLARDIVVSHCRDGTGWDSRDEIDVRPQPAISCRSALAG